MNGILKILRQLIDWFTFITLATMCVLIGIQVFWRYVLNNALPWPEEMARYAFLSTAYCSIAYVCAHSLNGHLRIEVLPLFLSERAKRILNTACMTVTAFFFAFLTYISWMMMLDVRSMEMIALTVPLPYWWLWIIIVFGMACCTIFSIASVASLLGPDAAAAAPEEVRS